MDVFIVYTVFALITFLYNYFCYKKKKIFYLLKRKKFYVLNDQYYILQFKFLIQISVMFVLLGVVNSFIPHTIIMWISGVVLLVLPPKINDEIENISYSRYYIKEVE